MTTTPDSGPDCAEFVLAVLEWLDERDEPTDTVDQAFEVLASERRRLFLEVMQVYGESLTLPDAAEEVAVRETGASVQELSAQCVANVYISLYHDHLPRLVRAGLVEYDQERDLVSPVGLT
ncbi:DUF7344 domain-containing protein [Natronobacterium gregoryi]|nr:hypothetical protein [Natronobacterium gregoryi]